MGRVADGDAHGGGFAPGLVQGVAAFIGNILKGAVALVQVKVIGRGVISDQQVELAVAVDIDKQRGQPIEAMLIGNARLGADVSKCAVAVVVEQVIPLAFQPARPTHDIDTAEVTKSYGARCFSTGFGQVCRIEVHIARHK